MDKKKIDTLKNVVIIVLSLVIVFGIAFVVPELKNCSSCKEEVKSITNISMDEYRTLLNGEEVSLIYIASPTCQHCMAQEPIMKRLVNEYDFAVNYLNVSSLTDEEVDEVYKLYGAAQEEQYQLDGVRTPTMLLVQGGKLLDINLGEMPLNDLVAFIGQYTSIGE